MQNKKAKQSQIEVGEKIKEELSASGFTQRELAERANMSESMVCRILKGTVSLDLDRINQIALALQLGNAGRDELMQLAYPREKYIDWALEEKKTVIELNIHLYKAGLPLLGLECE